MTALAAALADRYTIERKLGAGGMATVYLAHDLKHDRDVAIKVLHPDLGAALGSERFLTEIRTTARLQHPHILPLLDSGDANGLLYYVMPLVTGETLRARLEREKQLPIDDAVLIAREVADALGYAHSLGVIHRDIKPENVLLQNGHALVADFGIALAVQTAGGARMTQTGLSLGTPQYMSPEQAMGERTIDARSDIYALGAVTYEMLTGDAPFTGNSVQAIVAKVLTERPTAIRTLRDTVPPPVEHAVLKALAKLPADRFAHASQFAAALVTSENDRESSATRFAQRAHQKTPRTVVALVASLALAIVLGAWGWMRTLSTPSSATVTRVAMALPAGQELLPQVDGFAISLSHDGSRLAYIGPGPTRGTTQVWIRSLDALAARPLPGTVGAQDVQFSPDMRAVLITQTGQVGAIISIDGTQVASLQDFVHGTWGPDGRVYSIDGGHFIVRRGVGVAPDTVFRGDSALRFSQPAVLPGGDGAIVASTNRERDDVAASVLSVVSFSGKPAKTVTRGVFASILRSGELLYVVADGNAYIAPFDMKQHGLSGPPVAVARVAMSSNSGRSYPHISMADDGSIVFIAGDLMRQRLAWLDARGRLERRLNIEGDIWGLSLSPDGSRVAYTLRRDARDPAANARGSGDVYVEDLATEARTRLTSDWFSPRPSWTPDGKAVLYARIGGPYNVALVERRADATKPEHVVLSMKTFGHTIGDGRWLPDHRTLVVRTYTDTKGGTNLYYTVPGAGDTAIAVATSNAEETAPYPSPDGTLLAYLSDETHTTELYVQRFPGGGERLLVSKGGASPPRWSHDGRSLYYWDQQGKLVVATITSRPALALVNTRTLDTDVSVGARGPGRTNSMFDVAADGRILVAEDVQNPFDLVLVRTWNAGQHRGDSLSRFSQSMKTPRDAGSTLRRDRHPAMANTRGSLSAIAHQRFVLW